ncbi:hypothetical protein MHYP_G00085590 [Metynnis hypsauchen]
MRWPPLSTNIWRRPSGPNSEPTTTLLNRGNSSRETVSWSWSPRPPVSSWPPDRAPTQSERKWGPSTTASTNQEGESPSRYTTSICSRWVEPVPRLSGFATSETPARAEIQWGEELTPAQHQELTELVEQFWDVFSATQVVQHDIRTPVGVTVQQRPYRVPEARRTVIEEEVERMLAAALTLQCNQCIPGLTGMCTDTQTTCTDQCSSATVLVRAEQTVRTKGCAAAAECVSGSLNLGVMKRTINTQCCTTDRCNSQFPAVLPFGSPNGKTCYTCINNDCRGNVSCEGGQDRCVSAIVTADGVQVAMKGCMSRSLCTADRLRMKAAGITGHVSCCEGNLCNGAEGVKLSLLIILVPLIFSTLFI